MTFSPSLSLSLSLYVFLSSKLASCTTKICCPFHMTEQAHTDQNDTPVCRSPSRPLLCLSQTFRMFEGNQRHFLLTSTHQRRLSCCAIVDSSPTAATVLVVSRKIEADVEKGPSSHTRPGRKKQVKVDTSIYIRTYIHIYILHNYELPMNSTVFLPALYIHTCVFIKHIHTCQSHVWNA